MYTILKYQGVKKFLVSEMPALAISLIISEGLYKFGSFLLECSAFLITWYVSSFLFNKIISGKKAPVG
jgi:hypothetical protein